MIIMSKALVLTAPEVDPLWTPLIGWKNIITASNISASSEATGKPVTNLANPSTAEKWVAADTAEQTITISPTTPDETNYLAIAEHNFGTLGALIIIEGRRDALDPFEVVSQSVPKDDSPLLFRFPAQSFQQIQIRVPPTSAPVEMAVLYVGELLVLRNGIKPGFTPPSLGRTTKSVNGRSQSGAYLGTIITGSGVKSNPSFENIDYDWYLEHFDPFIVASKDTPFFFAWSPQHYPKDIGFMWLSNDAKPNINEQIGTVQISLSMDGISQ